MKKILGNRYIKLILTMILSFVLLEAGALLGLIPQAPFALSGNDVLAFAGRYFNFIGIWMVIIFFCFKKNREILPKLGRGGAGNNLKTVLLIGLSCGIVMNLMVAIVAILHGDITLSFAKFSPVYVLLFLIVITVQSGAEELVCRFFLYQRVKQLFPNVPLLPIIVNAVFFSILHGANPGVTPLSLINILLVGILYSLIVYYFDSFWAAVIAHASWNFCQNILLGLPNSGMVSPYSIFHLDTARNSFAYNTGFGIEGTILSSLLLAAACVIIIMVGRKKRATEKSSISSEYTEKQFSDPCTAC